MFNYTASTGPGGTASNTLTVTVVAAGLTYVGPTAGSSTITGPSGKSPVLDGGAGHLTLVATNGATVLIGGPGDTLTGGKGADTYVFMGDFGNNKIMNYNSAKDVIELSKADFGTNPAALAQDATQAPGRPDTVITDPINHDKITLAGVSLSSLHFDASHFLLA